MDEWQWPYPDVSPDSELGAALKRKMHIGTDFGQLQHRRSRWEYQLRDVEEQLLRPRSWIYTLGFDGIEELLSEDEAALEYAKLLARREMLKLAIERATYFIADLTPTLENVEAEVDRLQARRRELERLLSQPGRIYNEFDREVDRRELERELIALVGDKAHATSNTY